MFCIFRVAEKKIYKLNQVRAYQKHAEREIDVPNANSSIKNERLIGNGDVVEAVKNHIKDCKLRKDNVIARELLFTASPSFFEGLNNIGKKEWVNQNLKFMKDSFGDNLLYANLHKDEKTWHITAMISPRFYNENKKSYILSNKRYFDGKKVMSEWQDRYHETIHEKFKQLQRGIKYSQNHHIKLKTFYSLINAKLNENDLENVMAKASNSILLEKQVRKLQKTLNLYSDIFENKQKEQKLFSENTKVLENSLKEIRTDTSIYVQTIKTMSELYKISQRDINKIIKTIENNLEKDIDLKIMVKDDKEREL